MKNLLTLIVAGVAAFAAVVGLTALVLAPSFLVGVLDAVVIADLWRWFAVPALHVPPLSVGFAFGLNLLVLSFVRNPRRWKADVSKTSDDPQVKVKLKKAAAFAAVKKYVSRLLQLAAGMLFAWGIGYLVARFWTHTL